MTTTKGTTPETEKKTKEKDPCTGEHCTVEMCRGCHSLEGCAGAKVPAKGEHQSHSR